MDTLLFFPKQNDNNMNSKYGEAHHCFMEALKWFIDTIYIEDIYSSMFYFINSQPLTLPKLSC